jgi:hypothetical protein
VATPGKKNYFDTKNAKLINLKSAIYNAANNTVTLTQKKPFALTKPVQPRINGQPQSGLQDTLGRLIDGDHNGTPGGNSVALLRRSGATISAVASVHSDKAQVLRPDAVDALFKREHMFNPKLLAGATRTIPRLAARREGGIVPGRVSPSNPP